MFCVFFYKNGVFKFEVGFLDSKEYCISVIGEVKRNVVKWMCYKGSWLFFCVENYLFWVVDILWMFMGCILILLCCYNWYGGGGRCVKYNLVVVKRYYNSGFVIRQRLIKNCVEVNSVWSVYSCFFGYLRVGGILE